MPRAKIQFHLDENVDHAIANGLRYRGIDVTTTTDAGLLAASDTEQFAFALGERRVFFTHDPDFLRLHAAGADHAGIAYCRRGARTVREVIAGLLLIHDCLTPEQMRCRVEFF
jgi:predicted nuclease of predicted toxin-antitoxin system